MTAVVALHGFTGHGGNWQPIEARLRTTGPFWAPDLLGHGAASTNRIEHFDDEVDRLAAALDLRFDQPVVLVGYSLGARIALRWLVRHARQFASAVLIGARAGLRAVEARTARVSADAQWIDVLERDGIASFVDRWQALPLFASQCDLPTSTLDAQRDARLRASPRGLAQALQVLGLGVMPDSWPLLATIEQPVRLLAGSRDESFVEEAQAMANVIPHAQVEVVASAGHNLMLETPDVVAAMIDKERESCLM